MPKMLETMVFFVFEFFDKYTHNNQSKSKFLIFEAPSKVFQD